MKLEGINLDQLSNDIWAHGCYDNGGTPEKSVCFIEGMRTILFRLGYATDSPEVLYLNKSLEHAKSLCQSS